jgi:hypothetical protein
VSLHGAESPQGTLSRAKNNAKNCLALENAANEDRKYCSTQFFSSLLGKYGSIRAFGAASAHHIQGSSDFNNLRDAN